MTLNTRENVIGECQRGVTLAEEFIQSETAYIMVLGIVENAVKRIGDVELYMRTFGETAFDKKCKNARERLVTQIEYLFNKESGDEGLCIIGDTEQQKALKTGNIFKAFLIFSLRIGLYLQFSANISYNILKYEMKEGR